MVGFLLFWLLVRGCVALLNDSVSADVTSNESDRSLDLRDRVLLEPVSEYDEPGDVRSPTYSIPSCRTILAPCRS